MKRVFLGLGSNLGDREENLARALDLLGGDPRLRIARVSAIYETEPQEIAHQPWFLNLAVEAETSMFPMQLLRYALGIEREMGRVRRVAKGPRPIDIDILLYGNFTIRTPRLEVPHPRMTERRFVLEPLLEIAPDLRHPVTRLSMREHLAGIRGQAARRIG